MTLVGVKILLFAVLSWGLVSCDDAGEASLSEEREKELEELRAELKLLRKEIGRDEVEEPKVSLEEWRERVAGQKAALEKLTAELEAMKKSEKEAREKLEDFREKYPE